MQVWRLLKSRYAPNAFDGEGPRLYGGRWNSVGTRVAYASDSSALAVLEVLVHLDDAALLSAYSLVAASLPDDLVEDLDRSRLPANWNASPVPPDVQAIGDAWLHSAHSLALRVPSAIVPGGTNLLIDPAHPDFGRFGVLGVQPFDFDPRLLR